MLFDKAAKTQEGWDQFPFIFDGFDWFVELLLIVELVVRFLGLH